MFGKGDAVRSLYKDLETGKRTTGMKKKAGEVKYKGAWWHEIPIGDRAGKPMKVFKRSEEL